MSLFSRLSLVFVLAGWLPAATLARSPEETLVAYVSAVQKEGLAAAVRFIHPEELATFRAGLESVIEQRVKSSRTRPQYTMFADPYNRKKIRPFKDDADFVAVFIKWMSTSGIAGVSTVENAQVIPLGYVTEGDLRHVVARFELPEDANARPILSVTTMKMDGAQPMLRLLPELRQVAKMVRETR